MYRFRLRSPLRWLWVVVSSIGLVAVASAIQWPWILLAVPVVAALLLLAPPFGVFRHDETPAQRTKLRLEAHRPERMDPDPSGGQRFTLVLVNDGAVVAEDFRIRLLLPALLAPRDAPFRPLATLHTGTLGTHWFLETVYDDTAVTFRAGDSSTPGSIRCAPGTRLSLAELRLVNSSHQTGASVEYQINGGTVATVLGRLELPRMGD